MKKHVVLYNAIHSKAGGGVTYTLNVVRLLAQDQRLDVHVVIHRSQLGLYEGLCDVVRLHVFDFKDTRRAELGWEQVMLPLIARMMGAEVVYSAANYGPLFVPRSVILIRNSLQVAANDRRLVKKLYWLLLAGMTWLSLWRAEQVVVVSRYAAESLARWPFARFRDKMVVVHHGVSPQFSPGGERRGDTLLAVGDLYVQKNYHTLIAALPELISRHPGLHLRIAGKPIDAEYAARLARMVTRLGLTDRVQFLGSVAPADLVTLYRTCRLFVFPSTVETFGNPLVEALACGTPIACSSSAAMPEIAGEAVEYFDPRDVGAMIGAIDRLLTDEARREALARSAVIRAQSYSWERCARSLADILVRGGAPR